MESKGFYSDNCAPVHPRVMEKMQLANNGYVPSYGDDEYSHIVKEKILSMLDGEDAHFCRAVLAQT